MSAQFAWRASQDKEPSGQIAITADRWMLRLYEIRAYGARGTSVGWEVRSPDVKSVTGGTSKSIPEAKVDVSHALAKARENRRVSNSPARMAAIRGWRSECLRQFHRDGTDSSPR